MKVLILALQVAVATAVVAQSQTEKISSSPVADAARFWLEREAKNLTAATEAMPADKYDFRPTPQQMTFAHLMTHIAGSNRKLCSSIAGESEPKDSGVTDKDAKDKLQADVKASFEYCSSALAKVDDSKLGEELPVFNHTRAYVMMFLVADLADHYSLAATYLRLNGLLPPTAQPRK
jgi:DinB superfamily